MYEYFQIRGETHNGTRIFPNTNCPKRTNASFSASKKTKRQQRHHQPKVISSLLCIPGFDPVRQVVLDYMHLLCNEIMKALLERWIKKKNWAKLGRFQRNKLRGFLLLALKGSIPDEFQGKIFDSEDLANWKASQYRFLLLYAGPFVLKPILPKELYRHFLQLFLLTHIRIWGSFKANLIPHCWI